MSYSQFCSHSMIQFVCSTVTQILTFADTVMAITHLHVMARETCGMDLVQTATVVHTWRPCIALPAHSFDMKLTNAQYLSGSTRTLCRLPNLQTNRRLTGIQQSQENSLAQQTSNINVSLFNISSKVHLGPVFPPQINLPLTLMED